MSTVLLLQIAVIILICIGLNSVSSKLGALARPADFGFVVFAVLAVNRANPHNDIFNLVFMLVLLSMAVQGSFLPWISKKLDMIDRNSNVLRTFRLFSTWKIKRAGAPEGSLYQ